MVSTAVMNFLMEIMVISVVLPVVLLFIWRLRTRKNMLPALAGAIVFLLFSRLLESIPFAIFVGFDSPISKFIRSNEIFYAIYHGIALGILEELGRYLAFRYFLPKFCENRETAISYGIGHGGMECILVLGWSNLQYYVGGTVLNNASEITEDFPEKMIEVLTGLTAMDCILEGLSGLLFLALQIALSVLVFQACRNKALQKRLLLYAFVFHALAYLPSGMYAAGLISHVLSVILLFAITLPAALMAAGIYKKMGDNEKKLEEERRKTAAAAKDSGWDFAKKKLTSLEEESTSGKK